MGFSAGDEAKRQDEADEEAIHRALKSTFRPEFLNRIDEIIVFKQLKKDEIKEIAVRMLKNLQNRLSSMNITVDFADEVVEMISDKGFDPVYGARPLRRAIQSKIEDKLSEEILDGKVVSGKSYECRLDSENEVVFLEA